MIVVTTVPPVIHTLETPHIEAPKVNTNGVIRLPARRKLVSQLNPLHSCQKYTRRNRQCQTRWRQNRRGDDALGLRELHRCREGRILMHGDRLADRNFGYPFILRHVKPSPKSQR
jgi:hypothetical protein